jgi:hypothetical protein
MILPPRKSDQGRADDEAAVIAAERIRSGAAEHKEDGAEALAKLGIETGRVPRCRGQSFQHRWQHALPFLHGRRLG